MPQRYQFLNKNEWSKLSEEQQEWRKAYNVALLKEAAKLQEEMDRHKPRFKSRKKDKAESAMVAMHQEIHDEQEYVLMVTESEEQSETEAECQKRKRDLTPPELK